MADEDEERLLEEQLELQLQEQRESLSSLNDVLASDPANPEVLAVYEELVLAIKDAEEGLLHLKRARLLREVDSVVQILGPTLEEDVKVEHVDPNQIEAERLEKDQSYSVGSKCRFRHIDGRWYNGQIVRLDGSNSVKISFLTPTSEKMLICKFFLQQRCRFGTSCRLSHGVDIPLSSLRKFVPTTWEKSLVGSTILALSDNKTGIWKEAELEAWDDTSGTGCVVFRDDGSSAKLGIDSIALSDYAPAPLSDEEESNDSSSMDESDSSEYEEEEVQGLGFLNSTTQQGGIQTETIIFAEWENHTRGIASKMMANMGYREGMGLGVSGQGMVDPIPVKVLPPKQSLDHALKSEEKSGNNEGKGKKRTRGGKRKQEKKKSAEAAKAEEESRPDVFSLINTQLAMHAEALNGGPAKKKENKVAREKKIERKDLLAYDDEVKELRIRVEKLEEMVVRNKKEKAVYDAAMRKLVETRKALAEAEATHASATSSLNAKEKEKRWLKF